MKRTFRDVFTIGAALFAMFFGAGNMIFPPYLGLEAGSQWLIGFFCYFMADIGLALLTIFAILRSGGTDRILAPVGKVPSILLMSLVVLCIGPMVAIPRTAASAYEISIAPILPGLNPLLFSALFFILVLLCSVRESSVVDLIGTALAPVLLVSLFVLIVKGVLSPIGPISHNPAAAYSAAASGIRTGYQTLDVLAAIVFGSILLNSAASRGYTQAKAAHWVVIRASLVAGASLLAVYLGLTFLGAASSQLFPPSVNRTDLVVSIVRLMMGDTGVVFFSAVVVLACLTTAVGLATSVAGYFSWLSGGRLSYRWASALICLSSTLISTFGLEPIISIAAPILDVIYPPVLVLILLSFFQKYILTVWVYRLAALGTLMISLLTAAGSVFPLSQRLLSQLPLSGLGLGWIVPAVICALAGCLLHRRSPDQRHSPA